MALIKPVEGKLARSLVCHKHRLYCYIELPNIDFENRLLRQGQLCEGGESFCPW